MKEASEFLSSVRETRNFEVFGQENYANAYVFDQFGSEGFSFDDEAVKIGYLDIEVASENGFPEPSTAFEEVLAITMKVRDLLVIFGCGEYLARPGEHYFHCSDEKDLLTRFLKFWVTADLDIVTGWNVDEFDMLYLHNRIRRIMEGQEKQLSPIGFVRKHSKRTEYGPRETVKIYGVEIIDYRDLYKKYGVREKLENYQLNTVTTYELDEKKISYEEYGSLHKLYRFNFQKFIEYNVHDTILVERLERKLKLIWMSILIAYKCRVNYSDVFSPIAMWDSLIYMHLRTRNVIVPVRHHEDKDEQYEGAFVKEPLTGLHHWIMSYDAKALYPSVILTYNLGADTIMDVPRQHLSLEDIIQDRIRNEDPETCLSANGYVFMRDKRSFVAEIIQEILDDRDRFKRAKLDAEQRYQETHDRRWKDEADKNDVQQSARKIISNACYGAHGNEHFRFFDVRIAEAITISAQLATRYFLKRLNAYLNSAMKTEDVDYCIAGDTDSVYINFNPLVQKLCAGKPRAKIIQFLARLDKEVLAPKIKGWFEELAKQLNFYQNSIYMKREVIAEKGIWTAKKRYVLAVWSNESVTYKYPKIKMTGIEAIRSSVPTHCRERIKTCVSLILLKSQEKLQKYIAAYERKFATLSFEDIAAPRTVNGIEKYREGDGWKSATPIQVRSSITHNNMIRKLQLQDRYETIKSGEKIKFAYLKLPNPTGENVVACKNVLPKEFGLDEYVDYEVQFEKCFLTPLESLLQAAGWTAKKNANLTSIFEEIEWPNEPLNEPGKKGTLSLILTGCELQ